MSQRLAGNIIAMVSMALWASGFVALQALLRSWDPLLLAPLRMALAALALTLVLGLGGRLAELRALPWRQALITGGLGLGCSGLLIVWGQSKSDAVTASIITTALPLLAALMSAAAGDERLRASLLGTPQGCLNSCNKFPRLKWLTDIVVSSELQTRDPVNNVTASGQHDDRQVAGLANLPADLETVLAGQHHVE